jgi:hypothetical protein
MNIGSTWSLIAANLSIVIGFVIIGATSDTIAASFVLVSSYNTTLAHQF